MGIVPGRTVCAEASASLPQGGPFSALQPGQRSAHPPVQQTEGWSQGAAGLLLGPAASPLQSSTELPQPTGSEDCASPRLCPCRPPRRTRSPGSTCAWAAGAASQGLAVPLHPQAAPVGTPELAQGVPGARGPQSPCCEGHKAGGREDSFLQLTGPQSLRPVGRGHQPRALPLLP